MEHRFPLRHIAALEQQGGASHEKMLSLSDRVAAGDALLILCGDRGGGKTQMATWWAHQRQRAGHPCGWYYKAHDLLELIRQQYEGGQTAVDARKTLERTRRTGYLVIDEFSELAGSEWERRTLTNLVDHRYDALKTTVIITNHPPQDIPAALGRSIWSRAEETGGVVCCDWGSYRARP
ncbi:hypothetical protein Rhal01_03823 [Rubritalea halochordaticola]|uniref:IstB-like ATP-binding domain-containing protein n=1 Tax=Rubritalea halochordaticola TaxID=714537 RepID=A0ABP9V8E0_9BACT